MEEFITRILSLIWTVDEQESVRRAVAGLRETLYRHFPDEFHAALRTTFRADIASALAAFFDTPSYMRNPSRLGADLSRLEQAIAAMRILRLEVAVEPTPVFIGRVTAWVSANIGSDVALDLSQNASVGAGARIVFGGRYREETLAEMLESVFREKRDFILSELSAPRLEDAAARQFGDAKTQRGAGPRGKESNV